MTSAFSEFPFSWICPVEGVLQWFRQPLNYRAWGEMRRGEEMSYFIRFRVPLSSWKQSTLCTVWVSNCRVLNTALQKLHNYDKYLICRAKTVVEFQAPGPHYEHYCRSGLSTHQVPGLSHLCIVVFLQFAGEFLCGLRYLWAFPRSPSIIWQKTSHSFLKPPWSYPVFFPERSLPLPLLQMMKK